MSWSYPTGAYPNPLWGWGSGSQGSALESLQNVLYSITIPVPKHEQVLVYTRAKSRLVKPNRLQTTHCKGSCARLARIQDATAKTECLYNSASIPAISHTAWCLHGTKILQKCIWKQLQYGSGHSTSPVTVIVVLTWFFGVSGGGLHPNVQQPLV